MVISLAATEWKQEKGVFQGKQRCKTYDTVKQEQELKHGKSYREKTVW